jgi:hypothetical protein
VSHSLPVELQTPIKALLFQNTPFFVTRLRHPSVLLSILILYKKKFLLKTTLSTGGRPSFVSVLIQQYIAETL